MKHFLSSIGLLILFNSLVHAADIVPGASYKITSYPAGNKALSIKNSSLDNQAEVVAWTETGVNAQRWKVTENNAGTYYISNLYTGKVLHLTGNASPGAKVNQYNNDASKACQWDIVPVEGASYDNCFYITQAMLSNNDKLYLEAAGSTDGDPVQLYTKKSGTDGDRQIWKLERIDETPNRFTASIRNEVMNDWKKQYYKKASTGYVLGSGGWWGDAEMFEIILDAYETTGDPVYKDMFEELNRNFIARNRSDWSYNAYNDDIAWMVIASVRAYLMFGTSSFLTQARDNFNRMYNRALLPSGMLRWKEGDSNTANGTNSCINGPAEVAACYLAIATGDESYYEKAKNLYALQRQYLYVPATGQVYDSFTWLNGSPANYNHWASTYNQGTFLGAALMLYNHYGDQQYKDDAQMIVKYTRQNMCNVHGVINVCGGGDDLPGFKGILMRYVRRFIVDLQQTDLVDWMQLNALHAYNNRNSKGVIWTAWWEKSREDFKFENKDYSNDPFGASTAVSAAVNAPLDKQLITKYAFARIEAENFNYLKGVFTEYNAGSEEAACLLGNIRDGYWTGYSNVVFGNNLAARIEFNVLNTASPGSIEVRLDSLSGTLIGTAAIPETTAWETVSCEITPTGGMHTVYLVFKGSGNLFQLNYFQFVTDSYIYPDITDNKGRITSSHEAGNANEGVNKLIDNDLTSKFYTLCGTNPGDLWLQYQSPLPVSLKGYAIVSADNAPEQDPKAWKLQASNNGTDWTDLDNRPAQAFDSRHQKKAYDISTSDTYTFFRLSVIERNGNTDGFQLSEWQLYGTALSGKDITNDGGELTIQEDDDENLADKWWQYQAITRYKLNSYSITSANGPVECDPKSWTLYASNDGSNWALIDQQENQWFPYRKLTQFYPGKTDEAYRYFKLHITQNNGSQETQWSEWQLFGEIYSGEYYNDITGNGGTLTARQMQDIKLLTDNKPATAFTFSASEWPAGIQYESTMPARLLAYSITVADDKNQDPKSWAIQGSNDGENWTTIKNQSNTVFNLRYKKNDYTVSDNTRYKYFRLNIASSYGDAGEIKIAEWELYGTGISTTDITSNKGVITGQYTGDSNENVDKLIDHSADTKYALSNRSAAWIEYRSPEAVKVASYSITAAKDNPDQDPRAWELLASTNGADWTVIDSRHNQSFPYRSATHYYGCVAEENYTRFRLDVTETNGANRIQIAEWQLLDIEGAGLKIREIQEKERTVELFPNPAGEYIHLTVSESGQLYIYNLTGQLIHTQKTGQGINTVNVAHYGKGMYIVRIPMGDAVVSKRFIKR